MLEKYVKSAVSKKENLSQRSVYTYFSKHGIEMNYTDIGIFLRNAYNSGMMPGYYMKQYEIGKSDRLEQIYYFKMNWIDSIKKLFGG
jgi:hypothetical protein